MTGEPKITPSLSREQAEKLQAVLSDPAIRAYVSKTISESIGRKFAVPVLCALLTAAMLGGLIAGLVLR